jgi:hypothetical protein
MTFVVVVMVVGDDGVDAGADPVVAGADGAGLVGGGGGGSDGRIKLPQAAVPYRTQSRSVQVAVRPPVVALVSQVQLLQPS